MPLLYAGTDTSKHCHIMTSLDMDACFGRVANETLPEQLHVTDYAHAGNDSPPELLHLSRESDTLSAPTPEPLYDKATLHTHASPLNLQSRKVLPGPGRDDAQDGQLLEGRLTQPDAAHQNPQFDTHSQPAMPCSQSTSLHLQEVKSSRLHAHALPPAASILATSWPDVTHVGKLRHGEQLRKAAAEAAATAAGQAARAESSVRMRTPPTIAFHSAAAKHAMVAAEAAAAAAAVTADSRIQDTTTSSPQHRAGHLGSHSARLLEGHAQGRQLLAPALRAGRLHASAPASPISLGKVNSSSLHEASHGLLDMVGPYTGCSLDLADCRGYVRHQHASRGEDFGMQRLSGSNMLASAASAPASPVKPSMAGISIRQHQQPTLTQQPPLASYNDGHLAAGQPQHLPQQQSMQSTDAGLRREAAASHQRDFHVQAQHSKQQVQTSQRAQGSAPTQQGLHAKRSQQAQQATWQHREACPLEDPFKASEQFPVCPESSLLIPTSSNMQERLQGLLTDCTNQHAGPPSRCCQAVKAAAGVQQLRQGSRGDAPVTAGHGNSKAPQRRSCLEQDTRRCDDAFSGQGQAQGKALGATELLSSLTEEEFWAAAREELLDTAEAVRHRSCMSQLQGVSPLKMPELSVHDGRSQHTPDPRKHTGLHLPSGITPLLGQLRWVVATNGCCLPGATTDVVAILCGHSLIGAVSPYGVGSPCKYALPKHHGRELSFEAAPSLVVLLFIKLWCVS